MLLFSMFTNAAGFHEEERECETVKALCYRGTESKEALLGDTKEYSPWKGNQGTREQLALLLCAEGEITSSQSPTMFWSEKNLLPCEWRCLCRHLGKERCSVTARPGSAPSWQSHHTWCPKSQKFGMFVFYAMLTSFWILGQIFQLSFCLWHLNITIFMFASLYSNRFWQNWRLLNDFIINICIIAT